MGWAAERVVCFFLFGPGEGRGLYVYLPAVWHWSFRSISAALGLVCEVLHDIGFVVIFRVMAKHFNRMDDSPVFLLLALASARLCSIGLSLGLYGGRYSSVCPASCNHAFGVCPLVKRCIVHDDHCARRTLGDQVMPRPGMERIAVDVAGEQCHGRQRRTD